jgi:hypothetical protein
MDSGGGSSGGAVVQYTQPWAAMAAGQLGASAASEAGKLATDAINKAIVNMNQSYRQAAYTLQPYRVSGVEALNKLNQYLGLSAYNPGAAPTAPVAPNLDEIMKGIKSKEVKDYIRDNTYMTNIPNRIGQTFDFATYEGAGAYSNVKPGIYETTQLGGPGYEDIGMVGRSTNVGGGPNEFIGNKYLQEMARKELANEKFKQDQLLYTDKKAAYDTQLAEYEQLKALYDQYTAEGPLTQAQITERITNQPGYAAEQSQGIDAISKAAAAQGYIGGGRALKELMSFGQNTLSKYYNNTLSQLAAQAGQGQQAATNTAQVYSGQGNNLASLYSSIGDAQANAALAKGNALSQALIAANQDYKVVGQQESGGGGLGGLGSLLGGAASLAQTFGFSSKALKDYVMTPSTEEILENVRHLNLDKWKYKGVSQEHIGPYAEEFKELFGVGDGKTINMLDVMGVLIGAVKELDKKLSKAQEKV